MTLHDLYARLTPYEIAFHDRDALRALIVEIEREAEGRGADPSSPQSFITMGSVGTFVRELQGPDAPPEAIHQYGALVFQAVHFTEADCPLYLLGIQAARYLVEGAPGGDPVPPTPAGYLQLPQHLFWSVGDEADPSESIDGMFWMISEAGLLHVLLIKGVRPDRPGFSTIVVPEAPIAEAGKWLGTEVRESAPDFSSELPGSELDGLYAVEAAGEVLKLLARFFAYVSAVPGALESVDAAAGRDRAPSPSALSHVRVTLDA
jgi:hypothetical protein